MSPPPPPYLSLCNGLMFFESSNACMVEYCAKLACNFLLVDEGKYYKIHWFKT